MGFAIFSSKHLKSGGRKPCFIEFCGKMNTIQRPQFKDDFNRFGYIWLQSTQKLELSMLRFNKKKVVLYKTDSPKTQKYGLFIQKKSPLITIQGHFLVF
jgi:hypothetical protein